VEKVVDNVEKPVDKKFSVDNVEKCNHLFTAYTQARAGDKQKGEDAFTHY